MPQISCTVSDRTYKSLRKRVLDEGETTSEFVLTALSLRKVECDESDYGPRSKRKKSSTTNIKKQSKKTSEFQNKGSLYRVRAIAQRILGNAAVQWLSTENTELGSPPIIFLLNNPKAESDIIDLICRLDP